MECYVKLISENFTKWKQACGEQTQFSQGGGTVHWHGSLQNSSSKDVKYNWHSSRHFRAAYSMVEE